MKSTIFVSEVGRTIIEYGRNVPKDQDAFMELTYRSHLEIDRYFREKAKEIEKQRLKFVEMMEKYNIKSESNDYHQDAIGTLPTQLSISHHICDHLLIEEPSTLYRRPPEQIAALSIYCLSRLNSTASECILVDATNKELSEFGGWKSASGAPSSGATLYYYLKNSDLDLELMMVSPDTLPKDWRKKLDEY